MLATDRGRPKRSLGALLRPRPLGLQPVRVVLGLRLFLGLGAVPLWALVRAWTARLVLAAGYLLGAFLGHVAVLATILRLGALASGRGFHDQPGADFWRPG